MGERNTSAAGRIQDVLQTGRAPAGSKLYFTRNGQPVLLKRQVIVYGTRRQPSYAWAFDRGDGLSNVGYGELLDDPAPLDAWLGVAVGH